MTIDPGGRADYFAVLTANIDRTSILITDAIAWKKSDYPDIENFDGFVEQNIKQIYDIYKFDRVFCETNNMGNTIISSLRYRYRIPVRGVTTVGTATDPKKIREGNLMAKTQTIEWVNRYREAGVIQLPRTLTRGLKMLLEQCDNFGAKIVNGKVKYEALQGHDDFITCLNLQVHYARKIIEISGNPLSVGVEKGQRPKTKLEIIIAKKASQAKTLGTIEKIDVDDVNYFSA